MNQKSDLELSNELFQFLQGNVTDEYSIDAGNVPKLSPDQAWAVIWYVGELHWKIPDHIDRCEWCGDLYDSHSEGDCLDYGEPPYHFCDGCMCTTEYNAKLSEKDES